MRPALHRRSRSLLALLLGAAAVCTGAQEPTRAAATVRDTALYTAPRYDAPVVTRLGPETPLYTGLREGLWIDARTADGARGWLRLTDVRLGAGTADGDPGAAGAGAPARGGVFARLSRSVSSLLGGARGGYDAQTSASTATIGIRGLSVAELETAAPDTAALAALARYSASAEEARAFAVLGGLSARAPAGTEQP